MRRKAERIEIGDLTIVAHVIRSRPHRHGNPIEKRPAGVTSWPYSAGRVYATSAGCLFLKGNKNENLQTYL